jgi:2-oxoisovalerate dehydrogenase E2 component (dihydrolipoyl transacylase)
MQLSSNPFRPRRQRRRLTFITPSPTQVGAPLLDILVADGATSADESTTDAPAAAPTATSGFSTSNSGSSFGSSGSSSGPVLASPAVRALARELSIDLSSVAGSGPGGRVLKEDVFAANERGGGVGAAGGLEDAALALGSAAAATSMAAAEDSVGSRGGYAAAAAAAVAVAAAAQQQQPALTLTPLRGYRRAMVKSATEAAAVPTFHYMDDLEMDGLIQIRSQLKDAVAAQIGGGVKLTYLPFVVKALSVALRSFPEVNAQIAPGGAGLLQLGAHNIGVAMATPGGLVVPNVKGVSGESEVVHVWVGGCVMLGGWGCCGCGAGISGLDP